MILIGPPVQADNANDIEAIKQTAKNYMESWYKGNHKLMKESIHKKLGKFGLS